MSTTELAELRRTIGQLRQCVTALRARYGDVSAVERLANDVERLDIDARDIGVEPSAPSPRRSVEQEVVVIPDTPYDPTLWRDADDEGVGGHGRHQH